MNETTIELLIHCQVIERMFPVSMVEMSITAEHLTRDVLAIGKKALRESTGLSDPIVACESSKRGVECGWPCGDGSCGTRSVQTPRSIGWGGHSSGVSWKDPGVMNLADYPLLDKADVLACRYLDGGFVIVEPGICVTAEID